SLPNPLRRDPITREPAVVIAAYESKARDVSSPAILQVKLVLKKFVWVIKTLATEEIDGLLLTSPKLSLSAMHPIRHVIPSLTGKCRIDQFLRRSLHCCIALACPWLIEQHHKCEHVAVGVAKKRNTVFENIANRHVQKIDVVPGNDRAGLF